MLITKKKFNVFLIALMIVSLVVPLGLQTKVAYGATGQVMTLTGGNDARTYTLRNGTFTHTDTSATWKNESGQAVLCADQSAHVATVGTKTTYDLQSYKGMPQDLVTKLALGVSYIENNYGSVPLHERRMFQQFLIWNMGGTYFGGPSNSQNLEFTMGGYSYSYINTVMNNAKAYANSNLSSYKGTGTLYVESGTQDQVAFTLEKTVGYAKLKKSIANDANLVNQCPELYTLAGAVYGVYQNGSQVGTLTTDANGDTNTLDLAPGSYTVKEITAPEGFLLDTNTHNLTVTSGQTATVNVSDIPRFDPIAIALKKEIEEGADKNLSVEGAEYTIQYYPTLGDISGQSPLRTWVLKTDENGEAYFKDEYKIDGDDFFVNATGKIVGLKGTYIIKETKAPQGLALSEATHTVKLDNNIGFNNVSEFNAPTETEKTQKVNLHINKMDSETGENNPQGFGSLAGAIYDVYHYDPLEQEDTLVGQITTDENGQGSLEGLVPGLYKIVESKASPGYVKDTEEKEIKARIQEINTAFFDYTADSKEQVHVTTISKFAITGKGENYNVEGAKLQILDEEGNVVDEWVTEEEDRVIKGLADGTYTLREEMAPDGYLVAEDITFEVKEGVVENKVEMEDEYTKVDISKADMTTGKEVIGAKLQILDDQGNVVEEWTSTDAPHRINMLKPGQYTLHEEMAPDGYLVAEDVSFEVEATGEVQKVEMKDDHTKLEVLKVDAKTGEQLPGAKMEILDEDGKVVSTFTTSTIAQRVDRLKPGQYTLREVVAPIGYELAKDVSFEVKETAEVQQVKMEDEKKIGKIVAEDKDGSGGIFQTGDHTPIGLLIGLLILSFFVSLTTLQRKNHPDRINQ